MAHKRAADVAARATGARKARFLGTQAAFPLRNFRQRHPIDGMTGAGARGAFQKVAQAKRKA